MSIHKVQNIFISNGTNAIAGGLAITTSNIAAGDVAFTGRAMKTLTAGSTVSDTDTLFVIQGASASDTDVPIRLSMPIPIRRVSNYTGLSYAPATRDVWSLGYNRSSAAGLIEVNPSSTYSFSIEFSGSGDKVLYSERPLRFGLSVEADASMTELRLAQAIAAKFNSTTASSLVGIASQVSAIVVGNGTVTSIATPTVNGVVTNVYGGTGATHYGVEITSKILSQFSNAYFEDRVRFDVNIDHSSGFGSTTTIAELSRMSFGSGTYRQVYNIENFDYQYAGVMNRRQFPIPVINYLASTSFFLSAQVGANTATTVTSSDYVVLTAGSTATYRAGEIIDLIGTQFEIKYIVAANTTDFVVTAVAAAGAVSSAVKFKYQYDLINIEFANPHSGEGANAFMDSQQSVIIAVPAIDAGGLIASNGTAEVGILAVLNPLMASVGQPALAL